MSKTSVKVYSTPTCPYCVMAKEYFKSKGVEYVDVNVAADRSAAMEMVRKSGQMGVPVIEIGENVVIGYRPDLFEELLGA